MELEDLDFSGGLGSYDYTNTRHLLEFSTEPITDSLFANDGRESPPAPVYTRYGRESPPIPEVSIFDEPIVNHPQPPAPLPPPVVPRGLVRPVSFVCDPDVHLAYVLSLLSATESAAMRVWMGKKLDPNTRPECTSKVWPTLSRASALPSKALLSRLERWFLEAATAAKDILAWELPAMTGPPEHYIYEALGTSYERVARTGTLYRICIVLSATHHVPTFAKAGMSAEWAAKWDAIEQEVERYVVRVCSRHPGISPNYVAFIIRNFGRCTRCGGPIKEKRGKVFFQVSCSLEAVPVMQCVKCYGKVYVSKQTCPSVYMGCSFRPDQATWYRDPISFQKPLHGVRGHAILGMPATGVWAYGIRCAHQSERATEFLLSTDAHHDGSLQIHPCSVCMAESEAVRATGCATRDEIVRWVRNKMTPALRAIETEPDHEARARLYEAYVAEYDSLYSQRHGDNVVWGNWMCNCPKDVAPRYKMNEAIHAAITGAETLCVRCLCLEDIGAFPPNFVGVRHWSEEAIAKAQAGSP